MLRVVRSGLPLVLRDGGSHRSGHLEGRNRPELRVVLVLEVLATPVGAVVLAVGVNPIGYLQQFLRCQSDILVNLRQLGGMRRLLGIGQLDLALAEHRHGK